MYQIRVTFAARLAKYTYTTYQPDYYGEVPTYQPENNGEVPKDFAR
jgi:hypothetical protein